MCLRSWASAEPCAHVETEAFETIVGMICEDLATAMQDPRGLEGVYLDLHGAMVTVEYDDGEAEILRRVRAVIGSLPLVVSLDWHANLSVEAFELCDAITIFRTCTARTRPTHAAKWAAPGRPTLCLYAAHLWLRALRHMHFVWPPCAYAMHLWPPRAYALASPQILTSICATRGHGRANS